MIVSLSGTLVSATPLHAVVETGGIGYEVHIPVTTAEKLPAPGTRATLLYKPHLANEANGLELTLTFSVCSSRTSRASVPKARSRS